jgi:hypothetical protein
VDGGNAVAMCAASASYVQSSNMGNLGRRAGAICSMLGTCQYRYETALLPPSSVLSAPQLLQAMC